MLFVNDIVRIFRLCCSPHEGTRSWRQFLMASIFVFSAGVVGCGGSPEVTSDAGLRSLDALYTAVTSRKPELVEQCATQVASLEKSGELSSSAADVIEGFIQLAKAGDWQQSAEKLDEYIRLQARR